MNDTKEREKIFKYSKDMYIACRECERKKIINYLESRGLNPNKHGGMGKRDYVSYGKLEKNYDLSNWKYIVVNTEEKEILISLQTYERDPNSKNYHILMDRIGVCCFDKEQKDRDYFSCMKVTSLELPLTEKNLIELGNYIQKIIE